MTKEEAKQLISKYNTGNCTEQERSLLDKWYMQLDAQDVNISPNTIETLGEHLKKLPGYEDKSKITRLWSIIAAVASVSLIAVSVLFFNYRSKKQPTTSELAQDIAPGGNKAILTLANGKSINLSNTQKGVIITTDKITYNDSTAIATADGGNVSGLATISTPKGGEYQITLPDGTQVWLNAATTLQFPTNLKVQRGDRKVRLENGEAYFEVAKDKKRPFVVSAGQQDVIVLGTHFNVNAYESGLTKTTLLEGSVKVQSSNLKAEIKSKILVPGEQSVSKDGSIEVSKVNSNIELAWKKGKIQFVKADLKSVMNMISRWYNIEVIYQYYPIGGKFTGSISRSKNISEVLNLLETTGDVRFKIEERKVMVMK